MIKAILNGLLKALTFIINLLLAPINLLIRDLFDFVGIDLNGIITLVSNFINNTIAPCVSYFVSMLPPYTKTLFVFYLGFVVIYYTFYLTYFSIVWLIHVIQKLKFW